MAAAIDGWESWMVNNVSFFSIKQTDTDLCHPNPCANGSPCFNTLGLLGGPDYYCLCQSHWQGKNCSRYRPPPPPPPPPSSPSLREFLLKRRKNLFIFPFVFLSIRFDSSCGHQAAARSILSRLGALPSSGGIIRIIIHASSKGIFPFLSLTRSLTRGVVKSTFDTQKLQKLFFFFLKKNQPAKHAFFSVGWRNSGEEKKMFFRELKDHVRWLCRNYAIDGLKERCGKSLRLRHESAFWGCLLTCMMALDKLLLFFFTFYWLVPNRAVFGGESSRKIERERKDTEQVAFHRWRGDDRVERWRKRDGEVVPFVAPVTYYLPIVESLELMEMLSLFIGTFLEVNWPFHILRIGCPFSSTGQIKKKKPLSNIFVPVSQLFKVSHI